MKLYKLLFVTVCLLLASCNNVRKDSNESLNKQLMPLQEGNEKAVLQKDTSVVEYSQFMQLFDIMSNEAMRREGLRKMDELKRVHNNHVIPLASIEWLFNSLIENYPLLKHDQLIYRLALVYEQAEKIDAALNSLNRLIKRYPETSYFDQAQFRRGEILFTKHRFVDAENAYKQVIAFRKLDVNSDYYEQAVYKQGLSQLKQSHNYLALNSFMHLLDLHAINGELFLQAMKPSERAFVEDVLHGINIGFSYQSGPVSVKDYFSNKRKRGYEYHIYNSLAKFYLQSKRYSDAVKTYRLFVSLNEMHKKSPDFLLQVIKIYDQNGFADLLIDARKDFVQRYSVKSTYWGLYGVNNTAEQLRALENNLNKLVSHYRMLAHQSTSWINYRESLRWYRIRLNSFSGDLKAGQEDAIEFEKVSYYPGETQEKIGEMWLAAELSEEAGNTKQAIENYTDFIKRFPFPLELSIEAHQRIVDLYARNEDVLQATQWRVKLVNADARGGAQRTKRTRYLAAKARFLLVDPALDSYRKAMLNLPLKKSLQTKRKLMDKVLNAYAQAASYGVPEVSTASTYHKAEIYLDLSLAIKNSEKPLNESKEDQLKYAAFLENSAQPFKEKAIEFHELNISRFADGLTGGWVQKSLEQLKELLPQRYNKKEHTEVIGVL